MTIFLFCYSIPSRCIWAGGCLQYAFSCQECTKLLIHILGPIICPDHLHPCIELVFHISIEVFETSEYLIFVPHIHPCNTRIAVNGRHKLLHSTNRDNMTCPHIWMNKHKRGDTPDSPTHIVFSCVFSKLTSITLICFYPPHTLHQAWPYSFYQKTNVHSTKHHHGFLLFHRCCWYNTYCIITLHLTVHVP